MSAETPGDPPLGPAPPSSWMFGAILALLCCWPLGIPSLVYASRVTTAWRLGDHEGAYEAAAKARKWGTTALVLGILLGVLSVAAELSREDLQQDGIVIDDDREEESELEWLREDPFEDL